MNSKSNILWWAVLVAILAAFLWFVPQLQGEYFSPKVKPSTVPVLVNEYRRTWAQIIGGFALLLGIYFTWRRVEISQQTLEVNQDQQVTERFTRAIDQLGASDDKSKPRLEIRVGGIYALERIARDSPARDYSTVIEVLMAYVQQNAKRSINVSTASQTTARIEQISGSKLTDDMIVEIMQPLDERNSPEIPADIQAVLSVLGRREEDRLPQHLKVRLVFQGTYLSGATLSNTNFSGVDFSGANLSGVNLSNANLSNAYLYGTILWKANLSYANLSNAVLWDANFSQAILFEANLSGAALRKASLSGATLQRSNLSGADLSEADLSTIRTVERDDTSRVVSTWIRGTDLSRVDLSGADLSGADLFQVDLAEANLAEANLTGANFSGANLSGALGATQEQLERAIGNTSTILPEYLVRPVAWDDLTDKQTFTSE